MESFNTSTVNSVSGRHTAASSQPQLPSFRDIIPPKLHSAIDQPANATITSTSDMSASQPQAILNFPPSETFNLPADRSMDYMVYSQSKSPSEYTTASWVSSPPRYQEPPSGLRQQWRGYQGPYGYSNSSFDSFNEKENWPIYDASQKYLYPLPAKSFPQGQLQSQRFNAPPPPYEHFEPPRYTPTTLPSYTVGHLGYSFPHGSTTMSTKRRGNLPKNATNILMGWLCQNLENPYPTDEQKQRFMTKTGLALQQINNWFINARRRQLHTLRKNRLKGRQ